MAENSEPERTRRKRGKGKPFPPGVSGNPGGRPKELKEVKELAAKYTRRAIKALAQVCREGTSEAGRVAAAEALLNRGWGKPSQALEHSGPGGDPLTIIIRDLSKGDSDAE